jgi:hypothetical protein
MNSGSRQRLAVLLREALDILEEPARPTEPHGLHTAGCRVWRLASGDCDCGGVEWKEPA